MKSQLKSRIVLLFSLILLFQACDWFGGEDDKPQKKSSEFVFEVDTLRHFYQFFVNDLDIIDDTSFVITGNFLVEDEDGNIVDEDGNIINEYNQIWWGKKKGYEFKAIRLYLGNDYYLESTEFAYFAGNHTYSVSGSGPSFVINSNGAIQEINLGSNINGDMSYRHVELIRPGEFYLYGLNGSMGYYKDGNFTKIDTKLWFTNYTAASKLDTVHVYALQDSIPFFGDMSKYKQVLITYYKGEEISRYETDLTSNTNKPFLFRSILPERIGWVVAGNNGIFTFTKPGEFKRVNTTGAFFLNGDGEGNFIGRKISDESFFYWDGSTQTELPKFDNLFDSYLDADYKGRLWIQIIAPSNKKLIIRGNQQ